MKKVFILDTNILLNNPDSIFKFDDNDVVIPISVIEEVDTFKKDLSETGRNARCRGFLIGCGKKARFPLASVFSMKRKNLGACLCTSGIT